MATLSFAVVAGFYFWIGPIAMILLMRRQIGEKNVRKAALSIAGISLVSWCATALLTYFVQRWRPGVLPDEAIGVAYCFGWAYLFATAIPSVILYCAAMCFTRSSRVRLAVGLVLASVPYILMMCWWLADLNAR